MSSKMKWVSQRVEKIKNPEKRRKAEHELWQGQCNCPYWHGVFGGLYLHHLRRNTYEHLNRAEKFFHENQNGSVQYSEADLNQDGLKEGVLESAPFSFYFLPHRGGTVAELDYQPEAVNVLDVLTRREEAYHGEIIHEKGPGGAAKSIHEIDKTVAPEVLERIAFDAYQRLSFIDHFLPLETTFEQFWKGKNTRLTQDPTQNLYSAHWKNEKQEAVVSLEGKWKLKLPSREASVSMVKTLRLKPKEGTVRLSWVIKNESAEKIDCIWGSEWNFNFFDREKNETAIKKWEIQDGWSPIHLTLSGNETFDYWQYPIETVAQTEKDYRLLHQGIAVFPHWRLALGPKQSFERSLIFSFSNAKDQTG